MANPQLVFAIKELTIALRDGRVSALKLLLDVYRPIKFNGDAMHTEVDEEVLQALAELSKVFVGAMRREQESIILGTLELLGSSTSSGDCGADFFHDLAHSNT